MCCLDSWQFCSCQFQAFVLKSVQKTTQSSFPWSQWQNSHKVLKEKDQAQTIMEGNLIFFSKYHQRNCTPNSICCCFENNGNNGNILNIYNICKYTCIYICNSCRWLETVWLYTHTLIYMYIYINPHGKIKENIWNTAYQRVFSFLKAKKKLLKWFYYSSLDKQKFSGAVWIIGYKIIVIHSHFNIG